MFRRKYAMLFLGFLATLTMLMMLLPGSEQDRKPIDQPVELPGLDLAEHTEYALVQAAFSLPEEEFAWLEQASAAYMEEHHNVIIELHNNDPALIGTGWNDSMGGSADVYLLETPLVSQYAVRGYLKPSDAVFEADSLSDQFVALLEPLKWNGYVWGVPMSFDPYVAAWSRPLLERADLESPPGDWAGFTALIEALVGTAEHESAWLQVEAPYGVGLLAWLEAWAEEGSGYLSLAAMEGEQAERLNYAASLLEEPGTGTTEAVHALIEGDMMSALVPWSAIAGLPPAERQAIAISDHAAWLGGKSWVIAATTNEEEAARRWIQYITASERQRQAASAGN